MEHSKNFNAIKQYYNYGLWDEERVRNAVIKRNITEEEFKEITNKEF